MARNNRTDIAASWRRSERVGLRRDRFDLPYHRAVSADARLRRATDAVLETLARDLDGTGISALVADHRGDVIGRWADRAAETALDDLQIAVGYRWSEDHAGTNGIGTVLAERRPVTVHGREHFMDALATMACSAAPVVDARTGRSAGAAVLASHVRDSHALMAPLAQRAAREIEVRLLSDRSPDDHALLERFVQARLQSRGALVAVTERRMMTNAAAARLVTSEDHAPLWQEAAKAIATGRPSVFELVSEGGTPLVARCEPVDDGSTTVGALVRLERARPAEAARGREDRSYSGWQSLTAAELGVAQLLATGITKREAAARLYLSPHTVDFHLRQIYRKLDITSRVELARLAVQH
jgi:DNA-binding CsgD family transcriptional regulator